MELFHLHLPSQIMLRRFGSPLSVLLSCTAFGLRLLARPVSKWAVVMSCNLGQSVMIPILPLRQAYVTILSSCLCREADRWAIFMFLSCIPVCTFSSTVFDMYAFKCFWSCVKLLLIKIQHVQIFLLHNKRF